METPPRSQRPGEDRKTPPSPPRKKMKGTGRMAEDNDYTLVMVLDLGAGDDYGSDSWLIPNSAISHSQRRQVLEELATDRLWTSREASRLLNLLDEKRPSNKLEDDEHARWNLAGDGPLDHEELRRLDRTVRHVYLIRYKD